MSELDDLAKVTIDVGAIGELVAEATRAYLHTGNASVLLARIATGAERFAAQRDGTNREQAMALSAQLRALGAQWREIESKD